MKNIDNKPFIEENIEESVVVRTFLINTNPNELHWHWDLEDRWVEAIEPTDWKFQFDNELPIEINKQIHIPAGRIHRVIKGTTDLKIKIIKKNGTH
jgi:phage anti-repressor protein